MSWRVITLVALCLLGESRGRADDKEDRKREAELEERLRKAEPRTEAEVARKKYNERLISLLGKADRMELLRLEPERGGDSAEEQAVSFHGYRIRARVSLDTAERRAALIASLGPELHWAEGWKALCFRPRHGLRAIVGKETLDFVLCFECHRMRVYQGDNPSADTDTVLLPSKWDAADKLLPAVKDTPMK